ncbi:MAG: type II toxin-antitoxin system VapC family toxin [Sphingomonadales bacterium]
MIVVDSSALAAIFFGEAEASDILRRILAEPPGERKMSTASFVELGSVMAGRRAGDRMAAITDLEFGLSGFGIDLEPVTEAQAKSALRARIRFGRGMGHGGVLNYGDCFSYALAKALNAPLLYVGNDFATTDVVPAL